MPISAISSSLFFLASESLIVSAFCFYANKVFRRENGRMPRAEADGDTAWSDRSLFVAPIRQEE